MIILSLCALVSFNVVFILEQGENLLIVHVVINLFVVITNLKI
jgi:hypothetical protein